VRNGGHYEGNNFPFSVFLLVFFSFFFFYSLRPSLCVFLLVAITFEMGTDQPTKGTRHS